MIRLRNLYKTYEPNIQAVKDVNLHIKPGEMVSIVGVSGAGKSTLVRMMIAEEPPTKGRIIIGGWDITNIKPKEVPLLRRQIGVVFQDFKLLEKKTVFENVAFSLEVCGAAQSKIKRLIPKVLKIVGLEGKLDRFPCELSGGEQQRVAIARSLCHRPKILIADEPTGNLDSLNTKEIIELLEKINEFGATVIIVSHNKEVVNNLKKRVITMEDGRVVSDQVKGRYML